MSPEAVRKSNISENLGVDDDDLQALLDELPGDDHIRVLLLLTIAAIMKRSSSPRFRVTKVRETSRAMTNIVAITVEGKAEPRS